MLKKFVTLIVVLVVLVAAWIGYVITRPPYTLAEAGEVCHETIKDQSADTPILAFTDEWKSESIETTAPGWFIWGSALAGEGGAKIQLEYICIIAHRELRSSRVCGHLA